MRTNLTRAAVGLLRGRPRPDAPVHILASRELTAAMRQLRVATGDDLPRAVALLNEAITRLYPGAVVGTGDRTTPHLVDREYIAKIERGHHSRLDFGTLPQWINVRQIGDNSKLYTARVPGWLVRAYDVAFNADGFLVDVYAWSVALQADQRRALPRRVRKLPAHVPPGAEYEFLAEHFADAGPEIRTLLTGQAQALAGLRARRLDTDPTWRPSAEDGTGNLGEAEDEMPEGLLIRPGGQFVARWLLHNVGAVPWHDRLLYRVGESGIGTVPFVVLPDTEPGSVVDIRCPVRAPTVPGTYRACLKMGWPDGTYCFPTTLLGLIVTLTVPPDDVLDPYDEWPDHVG
jgi:Ig-like domain from next to BRCA1 gene